MSESPVLTNYRQLLARLDNTQPESTCTARDALRYALSSANANDRDELFRAFRSFYFEAVFATAKNFQPGMRWKRCGFATAPQEGELLPAPDPATLVAFAGQLSPDLASYTRFMQRRIAKASSTTLHCSLAGSNSATDLLGGKPLSPVIRGCRKQNRR